MRKNKKNNIFYNICIMSVILIFYYIFDVNCPVKRLTGLPCAGCGMSRALYNFCRGNIKEAFEFHPLFPLAPIVVLAAAGFFDRYKKTKNAVLLSIVVIFFSVYIIRMHFYFPGIPPMDLYKNAVVLKVIDLLKTFVSK